MFKRIKRSIILSISLISSVFVLAISLLIGFTGTDYVINDFENSVRNINEVESYNLRLVLNNVRNDLQHLAEDPEIHRYLKGETYASNIYSQFNNVESSPLVLGASLYSVKTDNTYFSMAVNGGVPKATFLDFLTTLPAFDVSLIDLHFEIIANSYNAISLDPNEGMLSIIYKVRTEEETLGYINMDLNGNYIYQEILKYQNYRYTKNAVTLIGAHNQYLHRFGDYNNYEGLMQNSLGIQAQYLANGYYGARLPLENDLGLIVFVPLQVRDEVVTIVVSLIVIIALATIGLAIGVAFVLARFVYKPLGKLQTKIDANAQIEEINRLPES